MKRLTLILSMLIALVSYNANAAMYIVGNVPFGDWHTYTGAEMTDNGNGVYTYVTDQINGTVWFVFADNLTPGPNDDWNTFNGNYRYGPLTSGQAVSPNVEYTTQKSTNGSVSYSFEGAAGQSYQFTFDTNTMKFKVEGYVPPVEIDVYSVAGEPAAVFGETWNEKATATEMTLVNGLYTWTKNGVELSSGTTIAFKVVGNHDWGHAWPTDNYTYDITENGIYDLVFTIDPDTKDVGFTATKVQDGPVVDPITGDLFMLGNVNGNNWAGNVGVEMASADEDVYTLANVTIADSGDGYGYFSFSSKLGENADDWGFAAYRRGAVEDGTLVEDGVQAVLDAWGTSNAFKAVPGVYDVEVGLSSNYVVLTKKGEIVPEVDPVYIMGNVNDLTWDAISGVEMNYDETANVYTAEINVTDANNGKGYFGFTKKLADPESETPWDDIAGYRFGPMCDPEAENWVMTENLLNVDCELDMEGSKSIEIPAGAWTVTVDLNNGLFKINGTWPTDTVEPTAPEVYLFGDVNNLAWDPTQGVLMEYAEGIYTGVVTATPREGQQAAYIGFTKKLADAESETPWEDIDGYRFGPMGEGENWQMTEELLGAECALATDGSYLSVAIPAGEWNFTIDLVNNIFTINGTWPTDTVEPTAPEVYLFGDVNNLAWDPTQGVLMEYAEGIYTGVVTATPREGQQAAYIGFTKKLADAESETPWDDIAGYRFGPMGEGENWQMTEELLGVECALATDGSYLSVAIPAGEWTFSINLENNTFCINGEWPVDTVTPEPYTGDIFIMGNVNDLTWDAISGVQMTYDAENEVYTAEINVADVNEGKGYFGFTKKLAEAESETPWDDIAAFRFGPVCDPESENWVLTEELIGVDCALATDGSYKSIEVAAGKWIVTVDMVNDLFNIKKAGIIGDVNDDNVVNITDVTMLINAVLNDNYSTINTANADMNGDGIINVTDVTLLITKVQNS